MAISTHYVFISWRCVIFGVSKTNHVSMSHKEFPFTGFTSLAIHAGHEQDPNYAHLVPIYASSTFVYDTAEQGMRRFSKQEEGYIYTRWGNPTFTEAEKKLAAMECFGIADANGQP